MNWRRLRGKDVWALRGYRIAERGPKDFEVYQAQHELDYGQRQPKPAHFTTLKAAKEYGRQRVEHE